MTGTSSRRSVMTTGATAAVGAAVLAVGFHGVASAAMSSAAGIVAGGSLDGTEDPIEFSAFGSRLEFDDGSEPALLGSFNWYDPIGLDGQPLTLALVSVATYGPGEEDNSRVLTGTLTVNGDGVVPFELILIDSGEIGVAVDSLYLSVGAGVGTDATPVVEGDFAYEASGDLIAGNIQILTFS